MQFASLACSDPTFSDETRNLPLAQSVQDAGSEAPVAALHFPAEQTSQVVALDAATTLLKVP